MCPEAYINSGTLFNKKNTESQVKLGPKLNAYLEKASTNEDPRSLHFISFMVNLIYHEKSLDFNLYVTNLT